MYKNEWRDFVDGQWQKEINVRDFIVKNYTSYDGDENFLQEIASKTKKLWKNCKVLLAEESKKGGVFDIDTHKIQHITGFLPGYIEKDLEIIRGLQTDKPLKRAIVPYGGLKTAKNACEKNGYTLSKEITEIFSKYRKTHNAGVFNAYTSEMKKARKSGVITGLPDSYGRGRIIGDYRRVALYGTTKLIEEKIKDLKKLDLISITEEVIRLREEISEQIYSIKQLQKMSESYGYNITLPANNALEAFQWTYLAYLAAIKENNGAANSIGRISTFLDIYIERDLEEKTITESFAQEIVDQFVIKLRMVRHLRTPEYNELFAGDPVWITESLAGMCIDGRHMVTKNSYRFLHTLYNLGAAPEPNLTVLWSEKLPESFKKYCATVSIDTSAIQYENDDIMKPHFGDDYGISCCVSAMRIGKDMQYFGARCNLAKLLLIALNGGRDEITGEYVAPKSEAYGGEYLEYEEVVAKYKEYVNWMARLYTETLNTIHYMHDKYAYERIMMALHDTKVRRLMAFGIAGFSVLVDSLSAIKYSKVRILKDEKDIITGFEIEGEYPQFGNDDDRVDDIALMVTNNFNESLKQNKAYRDAVHTLSILTITSNVVYGKKTGATPDGRKKGEPFAPGANPMHGRDKNGALAVLNSIAKIPYENCMDGISLTMSLAPQSLGKDDETRKNNLAGLLGGYFKQSGHHININILEKYILQKAMEQPENYPDLTIRVSGYAVNFHRLSKEQQKEVISRTFHTSI